MLSNTITFWLACLPLLIDISNARSLNERRWANGSFEMNDDAWAKYKVDEWLPQFMETHNIPAADFLHRFPEAVGSPMTCTLEQPCVQVPDLEKTGSETDMRIKLVLVALTHFNDLFRMVHRLYSEKFSFNFRDSFVETFTRIYDDFTPVDINSTIPADDVAHILFTPVLYIPNVFPNEALRKTLESVINRTTHMGFGYAWKDCAEYNTVNSEYTNIEWSMQSASVSWVDKYHEITKGSGDVSVLDFLSNGTMLRLNYAKDMSQKYGWHDQAAMMFARQSLSLVLEANGVLLQRSSYTGMEFDDAAMGLKGSFDDNYLHVAMSPIHWGFDAKGNLTRQYPQADLFESNLGIPNRVIYGQSWACFEAIDDDQFTSNYHKPWNNSAAYSQSLYVENWDGTSDGFDANNPLCTFNLPVNNQPADIKTSTFAKEFTEACAVKFDLIGYVGPIPYVVYKAFIVASDAWATTVLANQAVDGSEQVQLSNLCNQTTDAFHKFESDLFNTFLSSFATNIALGVLFGAKGAIEDHFTVKPGSPVAGGFSPEFGEGEPRGRPRSNAFDTPRLPINPDVNINDYHPGGGEGSAGSHGSGSGASSSESSITDLIKAAENVGVDA